MAADVAVAQPEETKDALVDIVSTMRLFDTHSERLQLTELASIPPAELATALQSHQLAHLPEDSALKLIRRCGIVEALRAGAAIEAMKEQATRRGITHDRLTVRVPSLPEQFNPKCTMLSMNSDDLPFKCRLLPFIYQVLVKEIDPEGACITEVLCNSPILPMPVVPNKLPHLLFRCPFYMTWNSFELLRHYYLCFIVLQRAADVVTKRTRARILKEHDERNTLLTEWFAQHTDKLLLHTEEEMTRTGSVHPPKAALIILEKLCFTFQIQMIRNYERTIVEFFLMKNQPKQKVPVSNVGVLNSNTREKAESQDGIPDDFVGCMFTLDKIVDPGRFMNDQWFAELQQECQGVCTIRMKEWELAIPQPGFWTEGCQQPELAPYESMQHMYPLECLRLHWDFVFSDRPFEDTPHMKAGLLQWREAQENLTAKSEIPDTALIQIENNGMDNHFMHLLMQVKEKNPAAYERILREQQQQQQQEQQQ